MSIVTLDEARSALQIPAGDDSPNEELQRYVDGITSAVENYLCEIVEPKEYTERHRLYGRKSFRLWRVPVLTLATVSPLYGPTTWLETNLDVDPDTGIVDVLTGVAPYGVCNVTYTAGYATIPDNYKRGALVILQHTWETQRGVGSQASGVIGYEERYDHQQGNYTIPRKALEWLGDPRPGIG